MNNYESIKVVGDINFGDMKLDVWGDLDEPLYKWTDICELLGLDSEYSIDRVEFDNRVGVLQMIGGKRKLVTYLTERGLYDVFAKDNSKIGRGWRRVIFDELIALRKSRDLNISEQFEEWDHELDNIFFDEDTGMMMQSITVAGGDVEIIPYEPEEE